MKKEIKRKWSKIPTDSFHRNCWWEKPAIWMGKRHTWPHPSKSGSIRCSFLWSLSQYKKQGINSFFPDIDNQIFLQTDWTRDTPGHTQTKVVVSNATFSWSWSLCKKSKILADSF